MASKDNITSTPTHKSSAETGTVNSLLLNSASIAHAISHAPFLVSVVYVAVFFGAMIISASLNALGAVHNFNLLVISTFAILTCAIMFSFISLLWCKYKGLDVTADCEDCQSTHSSMHDHSTSHESKTVQSNVAKRKANSLIDIMKNANIIRANGWNAAMYSGPIPKESPSTQGHSTQSDIENIHLDVEMQGLIDATRAAAEAFRARAAEIDEVAQQMAESRDPAAVGQVIELVQSTVVSSQTDSLLQRAIQAVRTKQT